MATRKFTKGIELVRHQKKRFEELKLTREKGFKDISLAGFRDAVELASGGLGPKQTKGAFAKGASPALSTPDGRRRQLTARKLARRGIVGGVPLLPINVQSGKLQQGIRLVYVPGAKIRYDLLVASVEYAKYILSLGGTSGKAGKGGMVARGYKPEVQRRQRARQAAFVQFYVRKQRSS